MKKKKKVVVAGAGAIAFTHGDALKRLGDRVEIAGAYDVNPNSAAGFVATYGGDVFTSMEQLLKANLDAVVIATPPVSHSVVAVPLLEAGVDVFIEKPVTAFGSEAAQVIDAAFKGKAIAGVCCQREELEVIQRVRRAMNEGKLGPFVHCRMVIHGFRNRQYYHLKDSDVRNWKGDIETEGGALIKNQAPHHIDLGRFFMGDYKRVSAHVGNYAHPYITGEDLCVGTCEFVCGATGSFYFSNNEPDGNFAGIILTDGNDLSVEVQTDETMFVAAVAPIEGALTNKMTFTPRINRWDGIADSQLAEWNAEDAAAFLGYEDATKEYHYKAWLKFLAAIEDRTEAAVSAVAGAQTALFADACYVSSAARGAWTSISALGTVTKEHVKAGIWRSSIS